MLDQQDRSVSEYKDHKGILVQQVPPDPLDLVAQVPLDQQGRQEVRLAHKDQLGQLVNKDHRVLLDHKAI